MYVEAPDPFGEMLKILAAALCLGTAGVAFTLAALTGGCDRSAHPATIGYRGQEPFEIPRGDTPTKKNSVVIVPTENPNRPLIIPTAR